MNIPVFYSFARSGGTLINKCLSCHPDNLVLSEVNPSGALKCVASQAAEWLHLIDPGEVPSFTRKPYSEQIRLLHGLAAARGKKLIIRDWPTINYFTIGTEEDAYPPRSFVLEQRLYLTHVGLTEQAIVIARHASAVLASIRRSLKRLATMSAAEFGNAYLAYAKAVASLPVFHLEDFTAQPVSIMQRICEQLDVSYPEGFLEGFYRVEECTGDNTLPVAGRSQTARSIERVEIDRTTPVWQEVNADERCREANRLLSYAE